MTQNIEKAILGHSLGLPFYYSRMLSLHEKDAVIQQRRSLIADRDAVLPRFQLVRL